MMSRIGMTQEAFEKELVETFPTLYTDMGGDPRETCMAFGISVGNGWFDVIWELSEKIAEADKNAKALQVKEKFGSLRFYISGNEKAHDLTIEAENKTFVICEECGQPGKLRNTGWRKVRCDECQVKHDDYMADLRKETEK
jgi:hypothetical protein